MQVGLEFFVPAIQIPVEKAGDGIDIPSLMKKVNPNDYFDYKFVIFILLLFRDSPKLQSTLVELSSS